MSMAIESTNPLPVIHFDISHLTQTFRYHCVRCEKIDWGVITRRWEYPKSPEGTPPPKWIEGVDWCLTLTPTLSKKSTLQCKCTAPRDIPFDVKGNVVGYYVKSPIEELPPSYN